MAEPLTWERILDNLGCGMYRAPVFGGWLVKDRGGSIAFISDPNLDWMVDTRPAVIPEPPRVPPPPRSTE